MIDIVMTWPLYRRRQVRVGDQIIQLAKMERDILATLLLRRGQWMSVKEIIESVYLGPDGGPDWAHQCVTTFIYRLRRKLAAPVIENMPTFGYRVPFPYEQVSVERPSRAAPKAPIAHRAAAVGRAKMVATKLPPGSHLIRIHPTADAPYDRLIVVSEQEEGQRLFLSGWLGPPLKLSEWRAARDALFPAATYVGWERRREDGSFHRVGLSV